MAFQLECEVATSGKWLTDGDYLKLLVREILVMQGNGNTLSFPLSITLSFHVNIFYFNSPNEYILSSLCSKLLL